jgi:acetyl-CoA acetyltransferase
MALSDVCIVGAGTSDAFGFDLGKSPLRLQAEAFGAALEDAGLHSSAVDGLITPKGAPRGVDYEEFVLALGLDLRFVSQLWSHGRWATTTVIEAALVIDAGLASTVAIATSSVTGRGYARHLGGLGEAAVNEGLRDMGGGHGEYDIHGLDTPGAATALVAQSYMERYGASPDDLAAIAVAIRAHAARNPMAIMAAKPLTRETYFEEPLIVEPLRRADYCLSSEGATSLILTTVERARELGASPVRIAAAEGIHASRDDYIVFARPGMGVGVSRESRFDDDGCRRVYERAGIDRGDIAALYVYDSFTPNVWMTLERFGFCAEGDAWRYIAESGLDLDSPLPVNTNGGLLSEAHLLGYGHLVEMVRQLRGTAGARQVPGAGAVQWATPRGDSLILTNRDGGSP